MVWNWKLETMKWEETEHGFRLSFGRQMTDLQKLKMHFYSGFSSATGVALGLYWVSRDIHDGHSCWASGTLLAMFLVSTYSSWRVARDEWKRVAARFEPESALHSENSAS